MAQSWSWGNQIAVQKTQKNNNKKILQNWALGIYIDTTFSDYTDSLITQHPVMVIKFTACARCFLFFAGSKIFTKYVFYSI